MPVGSTRTVIPGVGVKLTEDFFMAENLGTKQAGQILDQALSLLEQAHGGNRNKSRELGDKKNDRGGCSQNRRSC